MSLIFAAQAFAAAPPGDAQIERGHKVYQKWCYPCHGPGADKPGTASLAARGKSQPCSKSARI